MALAKFEVTGFFPIRDAVTKRSVPKGQVVTLDDEPVPRVDMDGKPTKPLAGTLIAALVASGAVKPLVEEAESADASAD